MSGWNWNRGHRGASPHLHEVKVLVELRAGGIPPLELDLEILPFQLKLGNRVLLHQVDDGLDVFQVHKASTVALPGTQEGLMVLFIKYKSSSTAA